MNYGVRGVHINQPLSNLSVGYHPSGMVAEQIFNVVPVKHESDDFYKWDKGQAFRVERTDGKGSLRADGTRAKGVNFGATVDQYVAEEYGLETRITDRERDNADSALQLEVSKTRRVQDLVLLDQEIRVASILLTSGNYPSGSTTTLSGTSQWNNASFASQSTALVSQIKADIDTAKNQLRQTLGGLMPNTIVIPEPVAEVVERDAGIVDMLKHNGGITDLVSNGYPLAAGNKFFGLNVLRPSGTYQSEVEGETATVVDIWGKNVIICYVGPAARRTITFGLQFRKQPFGMMKQYRKEEIDATFYRVGMIQTEKVVVWDAGYLIKNVIA